MDLENFGGGMTLILSVKRNIRDFCVCEMTRVVQIYYVKSVNFHAGGRERIPPPLEIPLGVLTFESNCI